MLFKGRLNIVFYNGPQKLDSVLSSEGPWQGGKIRMDDVNRLVYQLKNEGSIEILQCKGHYDD